MSETEDVFKGFGIEVKLTPQVNAVTTTPPPDPKEAFKDSFLKIRETLTRIGIASRKDKILYQSCHILHKRGRYAILHFKELFALDGKPFNFSDEDKLRRNKIVTLLEEWDLCKIIDPLKVKDKAPLNHVKILHFDEKKDWQLVAKYDVGSKKKA